MRAGGVTAPLRLVLVGWGAIGRSVAGLLSGDEVEVVGVAVRDAARERTDLPAGSVVLAEPSALAALEVDVVAEAAGRDSVETWGRAALAAGADFIVSSVSAFADAELLASLTAAASESDGRLQIQTGALGGIDALAGAMLMGVDRVEHRIVKPPHAWRNTLAEGLCDLAALEAPTVFFRDSAAATATAFPTNANVAMTTALAGVGPERTMITLVADPGSETNRHQITASGAFGSLDVSIANNPLPENPKTSTMAALNLARAIQRHVAPVVI